MTTIYRIENLTKGVVAKRPSAICKTPYVADVMIGESKELVHTPALGCCGLCDRSSMILASPLITNGICSYRAELSFVYEPKIDKHILVGTNPKLAETLVDESLKQNVLPFLKVKEYKREVKIENTNSRFDFAGVDEDGNPFIMEIKNVPLADYIDCTEKDKKKMDPTEFDKIEYTDKIAYFPDGYRKHAKDPISPRALKHMNELAELKCKESYRTIMCYVVQRCDVKYFQPSVIDPHYREAFYKAQNAGVEMYAIQIAWNENGEAILYDKVLEIL